MGSLLQALAASGKTGGYPAPPTSVLDAFSGVNSKDGSDIFRLMSKANKYSQCSSGRKQKKADRYGYMAGQLMNQCGVQSSQFDHYHQAYNQGGSHGMNNGMLDTFRTGKRTENRRRRRQNKGRYNTRPAGWNQGQGKKSEEGSMFAFMDSDTSSSSSGSSSDDGGWF